MPNPSSDPSTPPPSPSSPPALTIPAPRFLPPADPEPSSSPDPSSSPSSPSLDPSSPETAAGTTAAGYADDWPADELPPETPAPSRKTGASRASSLADRHALEDAAAALVDTVTGILHERLTGTDPIATQLGVWLADEQDREGIAKPAAALVARRSGDVLAAGNPDLADLLGLGIAVAGYLVKQVGKLAALRRIHRAGLAPAPVEPEAAAQ